METQKPLGERITLGDWKYVESGSPNGSFWRVHGKTDDQKNPEKVANIVTRDEKRALANAEFISIAGNIAQKYPNVEEWESILENHYRRSLNV